MFGIVRAAVCGLLMMMPGIASAATLTATFGNDLSVGAGFSGGVAGQTAFAIDFDDSLGSIAGVLEEAEFLSFAWINNPYTVTIAGPSFGTQARTLLANIPTIAGVTEGFLIEYVTNPFSQQNLRWTFREAPASSTGSAIAVSEFNYSITLPPPPPVGAVPLPAGGVLLIGALAGLAALRRRRG